MREPDRAAGALVLRGELPQEELTGAVVDLLLRNKVHLEALATSPFPGVRGAWEAMAGRPAVEAAFRREGALRSELLEGWLEVSRAFQRRGIEGVLFKSPRWFPSRSSNLDVLVPAERFGEADRILRELGHIRFPHYREDHKLLYRTFRRGRPSLSVHLHQMVSWGKVPILEGTEVVARAAGPLGEGFKVSSPDDALVATVAHSVFETDQVRLGDLLTVRESMHGGASPGRLLDRAGRGAWAAAAAAGLRIYDRAGREAGGAPILSPGETERIGGILDRHPWARRRVEGILRRGIGALPLRLPRIFSKEHLVRYLLADPGRAPDRKLQDLASTAWNLLANRLRLRARGGGLVTIGGIDGSGKSSAARTVGEMLDLCEVPTVRIWTRGGFSRLAAAGKAAARRAAPSSVPGAADEEAKREFLAVGWRRSLFIWATVLEQALSVQRVRFHLALGRTVVADRYIPDTLADLLARLPDTEGEAPRLEELGAAASFLLGAAPPPHLGLVIDLPPSTAFSRKADGGTLEGRRRLAMAHGRMAEAAPRVRIDGTAAEEQVAQEVVDRVLRRVFSRLEGDPS